MWTSRTVAGRQQNIVSNYSLSLFLFVIWWFLIFVCSFDTFCRKWIDLCFLVDNLVSKTKQESCSSSSFFFLFTKGNQVLIFLFSWPKEWNSEWVLGLRFFRSLEFFSFRGVPTMTNCIILFFFSREEILLRF